MNDSYYDNLEGILEKEGNTYNNNDEDLGALDDFDIDDDLAGLEEEDSNDEEDELEEEEQQ